MSTITTDPLREDIRNILARLESIESAAARRPDQVSKDLHDLDDLSTMRVWRQESRAIALAIIIEGLRRDRLICSRKDHGPAVARFTLARRRKQGSTRLKLVFVSMPSTQYPDEIGEILLHIEGGRDDFTFRRIGKFEVSEQLLREPQLTFPGSPEEEVLIRNILNDAYYKIAHDSL